jgi:hypothetical protein
MYYDIISFTYFYLPALNIYDIETFGILHIYKDDMINVIFDVIYYTNFVMDCSQYVEHRNSWYSTYIYIKMIWLMLYLMLYLMWYVTWKLNVIVWCPIPKEIGNPKWLKESIRIRIRIYVLFALLECERKDYVKDKEEDAKMARLLCWHADIITTSITLNNDAHQSLYIVSLMRKY